MKKLILIFIMLLFAVSAFALTVGNSGIQIEGGLNMGGGGINISKSASEAAATYWTTARTTYWSDTRVALWSTARNTEIP